MGTLASQFSFLLSGYTDPNTGLVGASYTAYFYAAGTTTPKDIWTAYDKTGGAVQSATLDSTGSVLVFGDGVYKVVIKNTLGATVDTFDGIKVKYAGYNVRSVTASGNITVDDDMILADSTGGEIDLTLPTADTLDHQVIVKRINGGSNDVNILAQAPNTIDGAASYTLGTQNANVTISSDTANFYGAAQSFDADTLGGYSADTGTTATTVPVRDASGFLPGDVTGGFAGAYGTSYSKLRITYNDATSFTISADAIMLSNGTVSRMFTSWGGTPVITTAGLGGLDTGAEANSTWYNVWAIAKADGTKNFIFSVSATDPTMPAEYTFKRRIGAVFNDGSGNFVNTVQNGNRVQFRLGTLRILASANTGVAQANWTAVAVRAALKAVPPTAFSIKGAICSVGATAIAVAPNASYGDATSTLYDTPSTTAMPAPAVTTAATSAIPFDFILESDSIYYVANSTTSSITCLGYEDEL